MSNIFFASDYHFDHANLLTFADDKGNKLRNFDDVSEMNEYIIEKHNQRVKPADKIYMLGDISFNLSGLQLLNRMNGTKVLIKGNHDNLKLAQYMQFFKDVRATHQMSGVIMSHVPIHPDSLARWGVNIHGHLHTYKVKLPDGSLDRRYYNVSVECLDDYTPISLEEIKSQVEMPVLPKRTKK